MKKVLMINGSCHKEGCTNRALIEIKNELAKQGIESDIVFIGNEAMPDCLACGHCVSGTCVYNDLVNELGDKIGAEYGAFIVGSPVWYSGPTGKICAFLDRLFYSHGRKFAGVIGASVVSARRGGTTATFERLNQYFLISNMIVPGANYWNQVHGHTAADVEKDLEGLQTMRRLANNVAYLMKLEELGKEHGIEFPKAESKRFITNFMDGK